MNNNIENYLFYKSEFLQKDFCRHVLKVLELSKWDKHNFISYDSSSEIRFAPSGDHEPDFLAHDSKGWTTTAYPSQINNFIIKELRNAIVEYISELRFPWFNSWTGYSKIKFLRYSEHQRMAGHCDHISSLFDGNTKGIPILSIIGVLNDDYEGGELIMFQDKEIKMKAGDLIIFPSIFLYPHRIEPIIKGKRYSYVSWLF